MLRCIALRFVYAVCLLLSAHFLDTHRATRVDNASESTVPFVFATRNPAQRPSVTVSLTKNNMSYGEPIGLDIIVVNNTMDVIGLDVEPLSQSLLDCKLDITPLQGVLQFAPNLADQYFGGKNLLHRIPAGKRWIGKEYMQLFVRQPEPGYYRLRYRLELPFWLHDPNSGDPDQLQRQNLDGSDSCLVKEGELSFTVKASVPAKRSSRIEELLFKLQNDDHDTVEKELCAIDSPLIIPHLIHRHRYLSSLPIRRAFGRFAEDKVAHQVVKEYLFSQNEKDVIESLHILGEWNYHIDTRVLLTLMQRNAPAVTKAIRQYCVSIRGPVRVLNDLELD
jgi:hypothetical protein